MSQHQQGLEQAVQRTARLRQARSFAVEAHGTQRYGKHPYVFHLDAVAGNAQAYGDDAVVVAYLHDVLEDTDTHLEELANVFGEGIARSVELVSDEESLSREEAKRKAHATLAALSAQEPWMRLALIVKVADRLANVQQSVADGFTRKLVMYQKEHVAFQKAAFREGVAPELWQKLNALLGS